MVSSAATTVEQYLAELPSDRRAVVVQVRDVVNRNLPAGYIESMGWGMICWNIPLARYPDTYNGHPLGYVALAAQKHYYALYLPLYMEPGAVERFERAFAEAGKRLDMGKSCVRVRSIDELPLALIGEAVARMTPEQYIAMYERARAGTKSAGKTAAGAGAKRKTATKKATKKATTKATTKAGRTATRTTSTTSPTRAGRTTSARTSSTARAAAPRRPRA